MRPPWPTGIIELDTWLLDYWNFVQRGVPAGVDHGRYKHVELEAVRTGYNAHEESIGGGVAIDRVLLTAGNAAGNTWTAAISFILYLAQGTPINYAGFFVCLSGKVGSDDLNLRCYGEDADNIAAYQATTNNITNRTKTTAYTDKNEIDWPGGSYYEEFDVTDIIQEIVNRSNFDFGHHIGLMLYDNGSTSGTYGQFRGHENTSGKGPVLMVNTDFVKSE